MAERLAHGGMPVFQYGIAHLSRQSEKWKRRKCPIYDPGANSKLTEDTINIPKDELHLRKVRVISSGGPKWGLKCGFTPAI